MVENRGIDDDNYAFIKAKRCDTSRDAKSNVANVFFRCDRKFDAEDFWEKKKYVADLGHWYENCRVTKNF